MMHCNSNHSFGKKAYLVVIHVFFGLMAALLFACIFGVFVKILWPVTMTELFHVGPISYGQAIALVLLVRLLVGGVGHGSSHGHGYHPHIPKKKKPENAQSVCGDSPDMTKDMESYYQQFWEKEGREAFSAFVDRQNSSAPQK